MVWPVAVSLLGLLFVVSTARGEIRHSFLATGGFTRLVGEDGAVTWTTPQSTRDGWVLAEGDLLLTLSKSREHPGGAVVRMNRAGDSKLIFAGTQSEVNTSQLLANGNVVLTEAGPQPRLLELDAAGKIVLEFPLQCQLTNHHMQSRMTRKLANGNYLVPQLLDKVVREYTPEGKIDWEVATPHWPFTAIRLANGNTLIGCTYGNLVIEVDPTGKTVWQISNEDFEGKPIKDACGVQRLANGNTVIASYGIGENRLKLLEVTPAKKIVWTYTDDSKPGIHHFQILTTNGRPEPDINSR
ncbi:MAG TPA: hypothetical protein DCY13_13660 [Verrucomicrobiales bacterium]|nr:hypothetical protein [Verrucomicrobiales bacterium]